MDDLLNRISTLYDDMIRQKKTKTISLGLYQKIYKLIKEAIKDKSSVINLFDSQK